MTWRSQQDTQKPAEYQPILGESVKRAITGMVEVGSDIREAVFAKDGIEVRDLQRNRPPLVEPTEPINEVEINGETDAQRKNREVRNKEKRVGWENHVVKAREKGVLCNSFRWDEADAKVRSYIFLCVGARASVKFNKNARVSYYMR